MKLAHESQLFSYFKIVCKPLIQYSCIAQHLRLQYLDFKTINMNHSDNPPLQQNAPQKRHYSRISLKKKLTLIKMVYRKRLPIQQAIVELNLKKTTALNIIKKYKETGSLPMRKFKTTRKIGQRQVMERVSQLIQNSNPQRVGPIKVEEQSEERMEVADQVVVQPTVEDPSFFNNWVYMPFYFYSYT